MSFKIKSSKSLRNLWKEFVPLSMSDMTMAIGDPMITFALFRTTDPATALAAFGLAKAIAVFFESPIIMILHASNTLGVSKLSRAALLKFTLILSAILSAMVWFLKSPFIFYNVTQPIFGIDSTLAAASQVLLGYLIFWPLIIGCRRYIQGLLIRAGRNRVLARAGFIRISAVALILYVGISRNMSGVDLAGLALIGGLSAEALCIFFAGWDLVRTNKIPEREGHVLPQNVKSVARFYFPLANTMVIVWGARALLVAIIARSADAAIALAVWPTAWGKALVIANSTRMVQQIFIRHRRTLPENLLWKFALSVGLVFSLLMLILAVSPLGPLFIGAFTAQDHDLVDRILTIFLWVTPVPLFVTIQNALQGIHVEQGETFRVTHASILGAAILLVCTWIGVQLGYPGEIAAAVSMSTSLLFENLLLAYPLIRKALAPVLSVQVGGAK